MVDPIYSIIMTSYNHDRCIGAAIESVLAQTLADWELLVVDDCSPDSSWEVISGFTDPRITAVRLDKNSGGSAAYNVAYARARGEFVACLDCDDMFHPEKLERQRAFLDLHHDVDICGTFVMNIGSDGEVLQGSAATSANWFNVEWDPNDPASWVWQDRICHSSAVVRKSGHDRIGEFDESLTYTPDWDFWLRSLVAGLRFHVIKEPLTYYRRHENNVTLSNPRQARQEYASILVRTFHPYLARIGRTDLIVKCILPFLDTLPQGPDSSEAVAELLDRLLAYDTPAQAGIPSIQAISWRKIVFATLLALHAQMDAERTRAQTAEQLYEERGRWIGELETALRWNDEQRQQQLARAQTAEQLYEERGRWIGELETALRWNDEQRQILERRVAELETMINPSTMP